MELVIVMIHCFLIFEVFFRWSHRGTSIGSCSDHSDIMCDIGGKSHPLSPQAQASLRNVKLGSVWSAANDSKCLVSRLLDVGCWIMVEPIPNEYVNAVTIPKGSHCHLRSIKEA